MPRRLSEELTRKEMIDPQLEKAGWYTRDYSKVRIEIPVDGYDAEPWNGVSDYCLYRENGEVLAVVEAKRTTHDARLAEADREASPAGERQACPERSRRVEGLFESLLSESFGGEP